MRICNRVTVILLLGAVLLSQAILTGCQSPSITPGATASPTSISKEPTKAPEKPAATAKAEQQAPKAEPTAAKPDAKAPAAAAPKSAQKTAVRVGLLGISMDAPAFIAKQKGYFDQEGIDAQFTNFQSAVQMVPLAATGQLDVGAGGISAGFFNAIQRDIPIKMVADYAHFERDRSGAGFVVRKELIDSGAVKTAADLKGMTVAVNGLNGNISQIILDRMLQGAGLTDENVRVVEVGFADIMTAIANRSIDSGFVVEPMTTTGTERGLFKMLGKADVLYPGQQNSAVFYSPQFAQNQTDLAKRFLVAWTKGSRDYERAFIKGEGKDEVIGILSTYSTIKDPALWNKIEMTALNLDCYLNVKSIEDDQEWYFQRGYLKQKVDLSKAVDHQFADYVVSTLGKYKP